jgi:hypothetical protein
MGEKAAFEKYEGRMGRVRSHKHFGFVLDGKEWHLMTSLSNLESVALNEARDN